MEEDVGRKGVVAEPLLASNDDVVQPEKLLQDVLDACSNDVFGKRAGEAMNGLVTMFQEDVDAQLRGKLTVPDIKEHGQLTRETLAGILLKLRTGLLGAFKVLMYVKDLPTEAKPSVGNVDCSKFMTIETFDQFMSDKLPLIIQQSIATFVTANNNTGDNETLVGDKPPAHLSNPILNDTEEVNDKQKHTLVIENDANDGKFTEEAWTTVVRKNLSNKLKDVPVNKAVLTKNGKGCVMVPDAETLEKAKSALEQDYNVEAQITTHKKSLPKLKIVAVDTFTNDQKEELKKELLGKNNKISKLVANKHDFDVVFINEREHYAVIRVSAGIRKCILQDGSKVHMKLGIHPVRDHFHLTMCFTCQQYGHKSNSTYCPGNVKCLYCAKSHMSKSCPNKYNKNNHTCANCLASPMYKNRAHGHTTTSNGCPFVIRETATLMSRTEGCERLDPFRYLGLPSVSN